MAQAGCESIPQWWLDASTFTPCSGSADIACSPFGVPQIVSELVAKDGNEKPTLTADELEMYFLSDANGADAGVGEGIVSITTRATISDAWGSPTALDAVNSSWRQTSPAVSGDGLSLWVSSDRPGGQGGLDIWLSTRGDAGGPWAAPVPVTALNSTADEIPRPPGAHSSIMPLSRRPKSSAPYQVWLASRVAPSSSWAPPVACSSVDTANLDDDGYLMDDGLTLYFSSDRLTGSQDLFVTERPDPSSPFAAPVPLATLNESTSSERDPWVSSDQHEIYFTSDRTGTLQIYRATR